MVVKNSGRDSPLRAILARVAGIHKYNAVLA